MFNYKIVECLREHSHLFGRVPCPRCNFKFQYQKYSSILHIIRKNDISIDSDAENRKFEFGRRRIKARAIVLRMHLYASVCVCPCVLRAFVCDCDVKFYTSMRPCAGELVYKLWPIRVTRLDGWHGQQLLNNCTTFYA